MSIETNKGSLTTTYMAANLTPDIEVVLNQWQIENKVNRLWQRDKTLWTDHDENNWMGWLNLSEENNAWSSIQAFANENRANNIKHIVLLGMGGSSLCPLMFAETFGKIDGWPSLHVLDSTAPESIMALQHDIDLKSSLFIVSSKSGTTLEPNILFDYFYHRMQLVLEKTEVGDHFVAITDPNSALQKLAQEKSFKAVFPGVPSIGGRYSALSNFGMLPLSLMGVDIIEFLNNVKPMHDACKEKFNITKNPGVVLGCLLGVAANHGKNKITLVVSPKIKTLGTWLEQLIAESTGKDGLGLIPVDQEPLAAPSCYDDDRVFVYIGLDNDDDLAEVQAIEALEHAGFVVVRLSIADKMHLGQELFRWEIAIAVAGSVMGINPFNQPDVEESKNLALQFAAQYEKTGTYEQPSPFLIENNISLFADEKQLKTLKQQLQGEANLRNYLKTFLTLAKKNDYIDFAAFIGMFPQYLNSLQKTRVLVRNKTKLATCFGFGPRFLHSTGQAYKGGPNTGLFFQVTANHEKDVPVPGHRYTFGAIINAQAQADFNVLAKRNRRLLKIHFENNIEEGLNILYALFDEIFAREWHARN